MDDETEYTEDKVAKRLFTPSTDDDIRIRSKQNSPEKAATVRDPLHGYGRRRDTSSTRKNTFRMSLLGAVVFFLLCFGAVFVTGWLNYDQEWSTITFEDVTRFFSNEPLRSPSNRNRSAGGFNFLRGMKPLLGIFGALPVALLVGMCCCAFTCLLMFYDSDVPGNFPPTPVSPRKQGRDTTYNTRWHLGYIFAPINFFVVFSLALFHLRWNMDLPLYPKV